MSFETLFECMNWNEMSNSSAIGKYPSDRNIFLWQKTSLKFIIKKKFFTPKFLIFLHQKFAFYSTFFTHNTSRIFCFYTEFYTKNLDFYTNFITRIFGFFTPIFLHVYLAFLQQIDFNTNVITRIFGFFTSIFLHVYLVFLQQFFYTKLSFF